MDEVQRAAGGDER